MLRCRKQRLATRFLALWKVARRRRLDHLFDASEVCMASASNGTVRAMKICIESIGC